LTLSVWRIWTTEGLRRDQLSYGAMLWPGRGHLPPPDGLPVIYAGGTSWRERRMRT